MSGKQFTNGRSQTEEHRQSPHFVRIYTSQAHVYSSYYDVSIVFGESIPRSPGSNQNRVIDNASVSMSPEHARALYNVLGTTLETYEKNFGPIRPQPAPRLKLEETAPRDPEV